MGNFTGGLGSQLGWAAETTYGTTVTPNRFLPYNPGETFKLTRTFLMSKGLRAGRMFQSAPLRVATTRAGSGTVNFELPNQNFGPILNLLHGNTVVPTKEGATSVYKQVHEIGITDPYKKSLTVQFGKPNVQGTVEPYTYPGSVLMDLEISQPLTGFATAICTFDSKDEITATALATASYPAGVAPYHFDQCVLKVGGVEQKLARDMKIKLTAAKDVGRFYLGSVTKALPLSNAYVSGTISLTVDYNDQTLYNLFAKAEQTSLEVTWTGETVEAIPVELKLVCAAVGLDGDSPNVANEGVLQQQIPLVILDNGSVAPLVATYVSKDKEL